MAGLTDIADELGRRAEELGAGAARMFEPVVRLGVTGLSRSGKTVFITSLVANLLDRGRMTGFAPSGRIAAAYLQPQPDDTVPRFDYETHLAALTGPDPHWPESTRAVSQLRLSLKVRPEGMLGALAGTRTVHLDIVDYPGEWLLDLGLMDKSFAQWSEGVLSRLAQRGTGQDYLAALGGIDPASGYEELPAQALASAYTAALREARDAGLSDCSPGRFLLPGDLEGAPVLTFAPLPPAEQPGRNSMWREMERRFEAYKRGVVRPFFRDHFARIDRQVVLVDALGAIHDGPAAVEDMRRAMGEILRAFRPGANGFLARLMRGRRIDRILFAATKADHLHHAQHGQLTRIMEALLRDARDRAAFAGAGTKAMSIAALRATVEETRRHGGQSLDCVRGRLEDGGQVALYPGALPEDPARLLGPAREGAREWLGADYEIMKFAPARLSLTPGDGPPHIRLDRALQFLLGDRL